MSKTTIILDLKELHKLERELPGSADRIVRELAFELKADIKTHWSATSPSSPGQPPAVVLGNLTNSIMARPYRRMVWRVDVDAEYGYPLEFGTARMAARPFVRPAVWRLAKTIPARFRALIK